MWEEKEEGREKGNMFPMKLEGGAKSDLQMSEKNVKREDKE